MARIDSSSSRAPYDWDMLMHPSPMAETSGPPFPSFRLTIASLQQCLRHHSHVILKQFYLNCLAHASYLVADEEGGVAAVIDPQRDVDQYLTFAAEHNLSIVYVFLTHFHADFIAGHLELRDRVGATICLGRKAVAEYGFKPVGDGTVIDLGAVRIEILETPGHTVESISLVVYDRRSRPDPGSPIADPVAVLT